MIGFLDLPLVARAALAAAATVPPAQALVDALLPYSPSLLLLADLGTLQTGGAPSVAGDGTLVASQVGIWQDQSGIGNHAAQVTSTAQGRLLSTDPSGRRCLRLDTVDDGYDTPCVIDNSSPGWAIIVVERPTTGGNLCTLQSYDKNAVISLGSANYSFICDGFVRTSGAAPAAPGTLHIGAMTQAGTEAELRAHVDGLDITNSYNGTDGWGRLGIANCGLYSPRPAGSDLFAVCVVPYSSYAPVTSLLAAYYGIPLSA